jgi:hypothetical protein
MSFGSTGCATRSVASCAYLGIVVSTTLAYLGIVVSTTLVMTAWHVARAPNTCLVAHRQAELPIR